MLALLLTLLACGTASVNLHDSETATTVHMDTADTGDTADSGSDTGGDSGSDTDGDIGRKNVDDDGDGYSENDGDCDDSTSSVSPEAEEQCDGIDNNCNGVIDEGLDEFVLYADTDGDGFGDPGTSIRSCYNKLTNYTSADTATDCDDTNANVNPERAEVNGNGIDDNCNGSTDSFLVSFSWDSNEVASNVEVNLTDVTGVVNVFSYHGTNGLMMDLDYDHNTLNGVASSYWDYTLYTITDTAIVMITATQEGYACVILGGDEQSVAAAQNDYSYCVPVAISTVDMVNYTYAG